MPTKDDNTDETVTGNIVYVLSDSRSGSTLLDQLLGAHSEIISLGEIHHLAAYVRSDRSLYNPAHPLVCSCGQAIGDCRFWQEVEQRLGKSLNDLKLSSRTPTDVDSGRRQITIIGRIVRRLLSRSPQLFSHQPISGYLDNKRVAADSFAFFDAIFEQHGRVKYLVDSSKSPFRFRALYDASPARMIALVLVRDYRGTVYSKVKRGRDLRESAEGWARKMGQIKTLTRTVPAQQTIHLRYEDLCTDPRRELGRICSQLGLEFVEEMLTRPVSNTHHIGGSPSKFDPSKMTIRLDDSFTTAFDEDELSLMRKIVGDVAAEWGYD